LALQRGGEAVDDPMAWLDSLPDDVLTLWDAYYRLEPWGGEYHRHAAEMEVLETILAYVVNRHVTEKSKVYKPRSRADFMPAGYAGERPKKKPKQTIGAQVAAMADNLKKHGK
jgi:hypothetical protein